MVLAEKAAFRLCKSTNATDRAGIRIAKAMPGDLARLDRLMNRAKPLKQNPNETICPACSGKGVPNFQTPEPGRRVYQPKCVECHGVGRVDIRPWMQDGRINKIIRRES
jgi:mono/diheme cytochrome c family protein